MMKATGQVVYNEMSGGFWGIEGDDGKKYCPLELPEAYQEAGLRVEVEMERAQVMSVRMWGINVKIVEIKRAEA